MRSALLTVLVAASLCFSVAAGISYTRTVTGALPITDRTALHLRIFDGRVRILLTSADRAVRYTSIRNTLEVTTPEGIPSAALSFANTASLRTPRPNFPNGIPAVRWRWVQPQRDPKSARVEISYVRLPAWLPPIVLLAYPFTVMIHRITERRRPRRGECPKCGYDLTGNITGLCSECGEPIAGHRM